MNSKANNPQNLSPRKLVRRDKILMVAQALFSQQGFRATTMERVAAEAGMSKVTVYGYFNDKDALFEAVAVRFADKMLTSVMEALESEGPIEDRIARALVAKHDLVFEVVRRSAFSSELFAAKNRVARDILNDCDVEIEAQFVSALKAAGHANSAARALGRVLFGAAMGVANRAGDQSQLGTDIRLLVRSVLNST